MSTASIRPVSPPLCASQAPGALLRPDASVDAQRTRHLTAPTAWLVVPCYNEATRLDAGAFTSYLLGHPEVGLIFVNDGSADGTLALLEEMRRHVPERVRVIDQQPNQGKAEAVRVGLRDALMQGARFIGYIDADLATPLAAIDEMVQVLETEPGIDIVMGARVALLGRRIERRAVRHYSGRVFATAASLVLALPVYDTQCGAKLMRILPSTAQLLERPFSSRWIFDVELLARYLENAGGRSEGIYELPLRQWTDVGESKVRPVDFLRAIGEMAQLYQRYRLPRSADALLRLLSVPFVRYVAVGALGTLLHYLVLIAAVEVFDQSPPLGSVLGAFAGAAVNYFFNYHLTFVSRARHVITLPRFLAVAAASAGASGLAVGWFVGAGVHYLAAQAIVTVAVLVLGFLVNRSWTFAVPAVSAPRSTPLRMLTVLRLPLLAALAYLARDPILTAVERSFDLVGLTLRVIDIGSTPASRIVLVGAQGLLLAAAASLLSRFRPKGLALGVVAIATVAIIAAYTGSGPVRMAPVILLILTNFVSAAWLRARSPGLRDLAFRYVPGTELLWTREYLEWAGFRQASGKIGQWWPAIVLVAVVTAVTVNGKALVALERQLRMPAEAAVLATGDFNGLALDRTGTYLFATGHGVEHVRRYEVRGESRHVLEAAESTGFAQGLDYDASEDRLYLYDGRKQAVLEFTSALELERQIDVAGLSPGDPWLAFDRRSETLTIASEADVQEGTPMVVVDSKGHISARLDEDPGNLLRHPSAPVIFMSYFRRSSGLAAFDPQSGEIVKRAAAPYRLDRMAYWRQKDEILVAAPTVSKVLRFDARTLEHRGEFPCVYGVREIAIDDLRNVILCGSLVTGTVSVRTLPDGVELSSYYLGPWLRTIVVDAPHQRAFVSSNGALYELTYGN